jgi:hypothetical protein
MVRLAAFSRLSAAGKIRIFCGGGFQAMTTLAPPRFALLIWGQEPPFETCREALLWERGQSNEGENP